MKINSGVSSETLLCGLALGIIFSICVAIAVSWLWNTLTQERYTLEECIAARAEHYVRFKANYVGPELEEQIMYRLWIETHGGLPYVKECKWLE